jgi:4-amino-4-deoxy-L-arabinose transferase-like glycosyltransferase
MSILRSDRRLPAGLVIAACTFFFLAGQAFIPTLGIQNDEALFGTAILPPHAAFSLALGQHHLPLMLMNYLGALKAWVYRPIFLWFGPGVWSLREPALAAGAASIWMFYLLLRRMAGVRAALIGCGLLAVDSVYLLTSCFDWGPVALQHLLLLSTLYLLLRFYQEGQAICLALGALCTGLAMWDKALSVWMLAGIAVAGIALFSKPIWRVTTLRRVGLAALFFGIGALPLIVYNLKTDFSTFRGKEYSLAGIEQKALQLRMAADGTVLFGWMFNQDPAPTAARTEHAPSNVLEKTSDAISAAAGRWRTGLLLYGFFLALLLAPLARGREIRAILFALIALTVQWAQMAITKDAGASAHHSILLWPLPQVVIAVSFSAASRRLGRAGLPAVAAVTAVMMLAGVLQMNEYYRMAWRNGGAKDWTDAVFGLSNYLKREPAAKIYCADWGMMDSLRILNRGRLPLFILFDAVGEGGSDPDIPRIVGAASDPEALFIAHAPGMGFLEDRKPAIIKSAQSAGFRQEMVARIPDSFGRPAYEVFRFAQGAGGAAR